MMTALPFDFPLPFFDGIGTLFPPPEREGKARLNKNKNKV